MLQTCILRQDPESALRSGDVWTQVGAVMEAHPNIRAVMACPCCGTLYIYDTLDSADWGGEGDGMIMYVPLGDMTLDDARALDRVNLCKMVPRLELAAGDPANAHWVLT